MRFETVLISAKYPQILFIVFSKGFKRFPLATQKIWAKISKNFPKKWSFSSSTRSRILWGMSFFLQPVLNTIKGPGNVSRSFIPCKNALRFRRRYRKGSQSLKMSHYIMTCDVIRHDVTDGSVIPNERARSILLVSQVSWVLNDQLRNCRPLFPAKYCLDKA